jgi:two-component system, LuxR family, sensor kinase FixL
MSWVTVIFSMMASASLMLGLICVLIWWRQRDAWAYLLFALAALGTAATAFTDLAMLHAESPVHFSAAVRWSFCANWLMIVALAGFVRVYLRAGRTWLLWAVCGLRTVALFANFLTGENVNYREITRINYIRFLGESVSTIGEGVVNPWMIVAQISLWLLLIFVVDASITAWRRGDRRMAVLVGGSIVFFLLGAPGQAALIVWGNFQWAPTTSLFYAGIIFVMAYEIASETLRATQLDRELHTSEQKVELASAAAGVGMWTWDIGNREGWASAKAQGLLGLRDSEHLTEARFMDAVHPDDRDAVTLVIERSMTTDHNELEVEYRVQPGGEETRWVSARGRVERNAAGAPILMRGVLLDISARRRSEIELQRLQGQLAHTSRVSMMGELATAIAHELHQPLGAILRNAEAAELFLEHEPPNLDELRAILADIRADDQRAREVIERLRALLKRRSIEPHALRLGEVMMNVAALTRVDAAARCIPVQTDSGVGVPPIMGDGVHLQQVLLNLVLNAMDAIDGAKSRQRLITVRAEYRGGRQVDVMVSDTGPGIPPGDLGLIFEPFFTTKASGMGIGLSVSRTIIEAHGGRLWAQNNATEGATFRFTLPTEDKAAL